MAKSTKIWDGTTWHDLQGPPGPTAVSTDAGNGLTLGGDGLLYMKKVEGLVDTDTYLFVKTGDNIAARYAEAKTLTPGGRPRSSTNRVTLIVLPGVYPLSSGSLNLDAQFVDILGLGSLKTGRGCRPAVQIVGASGTDVVVSANDVRITGLRCSSGLALVGDLPLLVCEDCFGGGSSFGAMGVASGSFTNCESDGMFAFGGMGTASGKFVNCLGGGLFNFGSVGTASGFFENCEGGLDSFGGMTGGLASGTFMNCSSGANAFGGRGGEAKGTFTNCSAGDFSFGSGGIASGVFTNCRAGGDSFGSNSAGEGTASGVFTDCNAASFSFGGTLASGRFSNCNGASDCFASKGEASGVFLNCTAGGISFGGRGTASGKFTNCVGGGESFGGLSVASGEFLNCAAGNASFSGQASGTFRNCTGGTGSFGGDLGSIASGEFINCVGDLGSFGSFAMASVTATTRIYNCVLTAGTFKQTGIGEKYRYCVDGNGDGVNSP